MVQSTSVSSTDSNTSKDTCENMDTFTPPSDSAVATTFTHSFQGWSVWIEPGAETDCEHVQLRLLVQEMQSLAQACGGPSAGMHPFVPHCTLLYNIPNMSTASCSDSSSKQQEATVGQDLLRQCLETFRQQQGQLELTRKVDNEYVRSRTTKHSENKQAQESQHQQQRQRQHQQLKRSPFSLQPTNFYYFPYPKHADDGKGFGCVICLIVLSKTKHLQLLQTAVASVFPPDERNNSTTDNDDQSNKNNFVPHVSLIYAPESKAAWLKAKTQDLERNRQDLLRPIRARYLSLWSTQGKLQDWYRIARVEL